MWYRVFGTNDVQPDPEAIRSRLQEQRCAVTADFHGDDTGWFQAEIAFAPLTLPSPPGGEGPLLSPSPLGGEGRVRGTPVYVERFLASEEGIRAELNTWAAYLETCDYSPHFGRLMEHMIQTKQLFTIRRPFDASNEVAVETICLIVARHFATVTDGVYQIDQEGFFDADGALVLQEY